MRASRLVVPLVLVASGLAFLSCGGDGNGPTGGVPTVQISPDTDSLEIGATTTLQATVRDANGAPVQNAQVFWNTENPQIATVSDQGVVTAVGLGTVRIAASSQGRSALASITVIPKPVASVTVKPSSWTLTVGQTVHLQATPLDANGTALSGRVVTWSSNNASVAAVDETGFVSALAPGSATITATSEGKSGTATITVNLPSAASVSLDKTSVTITVGQTAQLTATVKDANGATINGAPVTWTSSAPGVASVSASGLVTGVSTGAATITARSGNVTKTAAVTVNPVPANKVVISPSSKALVVGDTATLAAVVTDASGDVLTGRTITWSSSNSAVATVSNAGLVTAVAPGSATITATSEGKSGTATITVNPVPVASLAVDPDAATLFQGGTVQLQATPKDAQGNALTGRTIAWSTSNAGIASLSATSGSTVTVTATATGTNPVSAVITARCEGGTATATITVLPVPVARVTVSPSSASVAVGDSVQLTVTVSDSNGKVLTGRKVTWQSSNANVAAASGTGPTMFVKGVAQGSATIIATSEGASGTAEVTVTPPPPAPVATVTVSPDTVTITVGGSVTLVATLLDVLNNVLTGRTVTWSSSDTTVAIVDEASGAVHGVNPGTAIITATSEGKSGASTVTVNPAPPPGR